MVAVETGENKIQWNDCVFRIAGPLFPEADKSFSEFHVSTGYGVMIPGVLWVGRLHMIQQDIEAALYKMPNVHTHVYFFEVQ